MKMANEATCDCGMTLAHRTEWGCEDCGWQKGRHPATEGKSWAGQIELAAARHVLNNTIIPPEAEILTGTPDNERNRRVQRRYNELRSEHGGRHFETVYRIVQEEIACVVNASAALYAAAPDLYEALALVVDAADQMLDGPDDSDEAAAEAKFAAGLKIARSAIAKARGDSA